MKQKAFPKKLTLKKETVADLVRESMDKVKGGTVFQQDNDSTVTLLITVCQLSCGGTCVAMQCTDTACATQCPSGGVPCKLC